MASIIAGSPMADGDGASASYLNNWLQTSTLKAATGLTILGNTSASSSTLQELTLGTGLNFSAGTVQVQFRPMAASSATSVTSSTAVAVPNLSYNVASGATYSFLVCIGGFYSGTPSTGGFQAGIGGTATATNFFAFAAQYDGTGLLNNTQLLSVSSTISNNSTQVNQSAFIMGSIKVNASGTLNVLWGQANTTSTALNLRQGTVFNLWPA